tara:strand:- start:681 stop:845 length:165 start_codon:yes stop_codon:yes gene_type:complete
VLNKKEVFTIYLKFYEKSFLKTFYFKKIAGYFQERVLSQLVLKEGTEQLNAWEI